MVVVQMVRKMIVARRKNGGTLREKGETLK